MTSGCDGARAARPGHPRRDAFRKRSAGERRLRTATGIVTAHIMEKAT